MLNTIKTSLKKNAQQPSRIIEFSKTKNKIPLSKPLPGKENNYKKNLNKMYKTWSTNF